jgi:hypothetical protein
MATNLNLVIVNKKTPQQKTGVFFWNDFSLEGKIKEIFT